MPRSKARRTIARLVSSGRSCAEVLPEAERDRGQLQAAAAGCGGTASARSGPRRARTASVGECHECSGYAGRPVFGFNTSFGRLAQLVERLLYTQVAAGSSPAPPIRSSPVPKAVCLPRRSLRRRASLKAARSMHDPATLVTTFALARHALAALPNAALYDLRLRFRAMRLKLTLIAVGLVAAIAVTGASAADFDHDDGPCHETPGEALLRRCPTGNVGVQYEIQIVSEDGSGCEPYDYFELVQRRASGRASQ